jgi:hypothetical protein
LHQRVEKAWQTRSNPLHAPEYIERYLAESRAGLLAWAKRLGEPVGKVAEQILQQKAVDGLRPTRALLHLASRYSPQRLSRACDRALRFATPCYVFRQAEIPRKIVQKSPSGGGEFCLAPLTHESVLHPIAFPLKEQYVAVVGKTVDHRGGHLVVGEDRPPL